ncbi:MAG: alpha/beta hydrolase [Burkholderiales bacterium]|nr:alpha/beta hydrolase [Burkholderiales bacterium]
MPAAKRVLLAGPAGAIEAVIERPAGAVRGLALVAHPHPLYGGTLDNKVVQTLAKSMLEFGYVAVRPNFRGVGASEGVHDEGIGEVDDLDRVVDAVRASEAVPADTPLVGAGFSFGSLVLSRLAKRRVFTRLVFVGTAVTRGRVEDVPADTVVIHGDRDDVVPLDLVLRWAEPQELPVTVIPGADHFFHRRLHIVKAILRAAWHADKGSDGSGTL